MEVDHSDGVYCFQSACGAAGRGDAEDGLVGEQDEVDGLDEVSFFFVVSPQQFRGGGAVHGMQDREGDSQFFCRAFGVFRGIAGKGIDTHLALLELTQVFLVIGQLPIAVWSPVCPVG